MFMANKDFTILDSNAIIVCTKFGYLEFEGHLDARSTAQVLQEGYRLAQDEDR